VPEGRDDDVADSTRDEVRSVVDEVEQGETPSGGPLESLPPDDPLAREAARDELRFRRVYAGSLLVAMAIQLAVVNVGFFLYAALGVDWDVNPSVMHVWLAATVVEVIGITAVVTRFLFPSNR
jgi:hypothetical protein